MSVAEQMTACGGSCSGTEFREDCLINMLRKNEGTGIVSIEDLAAFMHSDRATMADALKTLEGEGKVIVMDDDSVVFTDLGLMLAREIRKKHHVLESFLVDVMGMKHEDAHIEAHQMEHTITQERMQKICHVTGEKQDNDCSACNNPCNTAISIGTMEALHEMKVHSKGKIAYLRGKNSDDVKKLISMGFVPGRDIAVESKVSSNGPRVVTLGGSTVAVDAELSKIILVNVGA